MPEQQSNASGDGVPQLSSASSAGAEVSYGPSLSVEPSEAARER